MKIVSFGDSFIYGTELKQEAHSWVSQCAEKLGYEYETTAVPGCGNENISMQILSYFAKNTKEKMTIELEPDKKMAEPLKSFKL